MLPILHPTNFGSDRLYRIVGCLTKACQQEKFCSHLVGRTFALFQKPHRRDLYLKASLTVGAIFNDDDDDELYSCVHVLS